MLSNNTLLTTPMNPTKLKKVGFVESLFPILTECLPVNIILNASFLEQEQEDDKLTAADIMKEVDKIEGNAIKAALKHDELLATIKVRLTEVIFIVFSVETYVKF